MRVLFLIVWGISKLFNYWLHHFTLQPTACKSSNISRYLPTIVLWRFLLFCFVLIIVILIAMRWYLIAVFLWWFVRLIIFSYTCWPHVFLLLGNVFSGSLPSFNQVFVLVVVSFVFCYWVVQVSYAFWKLTSYPINDLQIFSLIL